MYAYIVSMTTPLEFVTRELERPMVDIVVNVATRRIKTSYFVVVLMLMLMLMRWRWK